MTDSIVHENTGLALILRSEDGKELSRFDLTQASIPKALGTSLIRALAAEYGHTSLESQRQSFRCVRKLIACLVECKLNHNLPLPITIALDVHEWLASSGLVGSTAQSHQNVILAIMKWCARNTKGVFAKRTSFVVPQFRRNDPKSKTTLTEKQVKEILAACYEEIEAIEIQRARGDRLLQGQTESEEEEFLANLLADLLILGHGRMATQVEVAKGKQSLAGRVRRAGGITPLRDLIYMSPRAVFPYYLAITAQTSGNPMAIQHLTLDCIEAHPLRSDVEYLCWHKPRARSEQRVSFPTDKTWSAPSLVRRLTALTEGMRGICRDADATKVFLAFPHRGTTLAVPCVQLLHTMLDEFIDRHELVSFDFRNLREHGATAHRVVTGSVREAQKRLNHRSSTTTAKYTSPMDTASEFDSYIHRYQGQLIRQSSSPPSAADQMPAAADRQTVDAGVPTVFGFNCADPFAGIGGHSRAGTMCLHFARCSTCPGALVAIDDPAAVARMLGTKQVLEKEKARAVTEGWWARFKDLYEPTLAILNIEILPAVSESVLLAARSALRPHHIPHLE